MATPTSNKATVSFHRKTFGRNIKLEENGFNAIRHTSFDNGITFTSKPIPINEPIHMEIIDIDETGQWLGSLAIGFTDIDPNLLQTQDLCKSSVPNLCSKDGQTFMKRIFDRLTRQIIITFYYNQNGAFYVLDGKEHQFHKNIDVKRPLWAVIDIYGNVKGVALTTAPKIEDGSKSFFIKYNQKPDKLPIRYFTQLQQAELQSVNFHDTHGPELELFCQNQVAVRKNVQRLARPYLFIDLPMTPGDELYIRILSVDTNFRTPGVLGFTNAGPGVFVTDFDRLPSDDPIGLYDRLEYWILNESAFDEKLSELDEYRFVYNKTGEIDMWRNNEPDSKRRTVAHADPSQTFYPFFFLNGRIKALSLIGLISSTKRPVTSSNGNKTINDDDDDDKDNCKNCYEAPANCVLIPCGHIFFCSKCKDQYEKVTGKRCPVCRNEYNNVVILADD